MALMYQYADPLLGSLPPAKQLVNISAHTLANQQEFARAFGTSMKSLDQTFTRGFSGLQDSMNQGFAGVNSHIDAMGDRISDQIIQGSNYVADTVMNVGQDIQNTTLQVGNVLANQMGQNTAHLHNAVVNVGDHVASTTIRVGQILGRQMYDNTQHLSDVFQEVGAQLGQTIFQSTAMITGSMFIASLNTNRVLSQAIQRQTRELKNELLEIRAEQMHTRRAITSAQLLTYHELRELKVQTLRNHTETVWLLMRQSSLLHDILETLKHPLRTKALELAETGHYLMSRGLFQQARDALLEAKATIHDRDPAIAVSLAFVFDHLGDGRQVEERLHHAVDVTDNPAFSAYVFGLISDFYWQLGDKEQSVAASAKSLRLDPLSPVVRVNHAAILAEIGKVAEARSLCEGLVRDDTDHAKAILDRQTFYRHELVADVLQFVQQHLDPELEAMKNDNAGFQEHLRDIRDSGRYRQFAGHKRLFEQALQTLSDLKSQRERGVVSANWHRDVHSSYQRLLDIESDAATAAAATERFTKLHAAREEVFPFLDAVLMRSLALIDPARHPHLRIENEKLKAALSEIGSPDAMEASCELVVNVFGLQIRQWETDFTAACASGFLRRKKKKRRVCDAVMGQYSAVRCYVERVRYEKSDKPFQICSGCFTCWPRSYRHCGQCGRPMNVAVSKRPNTPLLS